MNELLRTVDIAKRVGTSGSRISAWKKEYDDFPALVSFNASGKPLYYWGEVRDFMERHGLPKPNKGRGADFYEWVVTQNTEVIACYKRRSRARLFLIQELLSKRDPGALIAAERIVHEAGLRRAEYGGNVYEIAKRR